MELIEQVADGVLGYTVEEEGVLFVPVIMAVQEGDGSVGRFLDSLPRDRTVKVPEVMSSRLQGMLERRGFLHSFEWQDGVDEEIAVMVRYARVRKKSIVDAVGRPIEAGAEVLFRRVTAERQRVVTTGGAVLFLFDYEDQVPPEIEVETRAGILSQRAREVGNCWKFDGLLVNLGRPVPRIVEHAGAP